jgi:hypothetical protein
VVAELVLNSADLDMSCCDLACANPFDLDCYFLFFNMAASCAAPLAEAPDLRRVDLVSKT